ncbi:protein tyrosine phosphatase family protein [Rubrivivax sp. RP6-9]|uniref:protein tyrosine phosphatase family protein n=1 Tax=Rubrivivax sp. RP6-9 TaxID=3415750 RepID=UPI003CC69DF8
MGLLAGCWSAAATAQALDAPNVVVIGPNLVTSGQPTAQALARLSQQGFEAVIYLAPSSVPDAVGTEPEVVAQQGLEFIHLPVPFGSPTEGHFESFAAALQRLKGRKVLVHCQVNMRASTMVFLYRVIFEKESPASAWESVTRVWSPEGPWKRLALSQMVKHGIKFDPF